MTAALRRPPDRIAPAAAFATLFARAAAGAAPGSIDILHDEEVGDDLRVQAQAAAARALGLQPRLIDLRRAVGGAGRAVAAVGMARALVAAAAGFLYGASDWWRARTTLGSEGAGAPWAGVGQELRLLWRHERIAAALAPSGVTPRLIVANNLAGLRVAAAMVRRAHAAVLYDSHEIEACRRLTRRGAWRQTLRYALERDGLACAGAAVTVGAAVAKALATLHPGRDFALLPNDHFPDLAPPSPPPQGGPTLVFFGSAAPGRCLEEAAAAVAAGVFDQLRVFAVGDPAQQQAWLSAALASAGARADWRVGPDYAAALMQWRATTPAPYAWIVIEPQTPSYRLAAPNKLHQALRARTPLVALTGTAVGALTARRGLGVTLERPGDWRLLDPSALRAGHPTFVAAIDAYLADRDAGREPPP